MIFGEQYYIPPTKIEKLEQKALAGSGRSAYRLARHEDLFGDVRNAIRWYKSSYELGYKQEYCLAVDTSLEKHLKNGVYDPEYNKQNQSIDPIMKTSGDSVNDESTQGHL